MSLKTVLRPFTLAATLTCTTIGWAATKTPDVEMEKTDPNYFIGGGHAPHGRDVEFLKYEALPPDYRRILENTHLEGYTGPNGIPLTGKVLYELLDTKLRVALMNFMAETEAKYVHDNVNWEKDAKDGRGSGTTSSVLSHIKSIYCLHNDRFFGVPDDQLPYLTKASTDVFKPQSAADNLLHKLKTGFIVWANVKSRDKEGSLQLLIMTNSNSWIIEGDIDKHNGDFGKDRWQGFQHAIREVAYNHFFHQLTNPYDVCPILAFKQKLELPYVIRPKNRHLDARYDSELNYTK